jgi:hypothetical protein
LHGEQSGETIEITLAVDIPDPTALAAFHDRGAAVSGVKPAEVSPKMGLGELSEFRRGPAH